MFNYLYIYQTINYSNLQTLHTLTNDTMTIQNVEMVLF